MKEPRLVMVPVDESEHSERALKWFAQNGWREGDRLILFHSVDNTKVIPPLGYTMAGAFPVNNFERLVKEQEEEIHQLKKKFQLLLHEFGMEGEFKSSRRIAHAGEAIVEMCREMKVDHVVMGNRGMGLMRRTFLGSTSDYVLHHVQLPVTIIPPLENNAKDTQTETS